jgi:hypothetical protein
MDALKQSDEDEAIKDINDLEFVASPNVDEGLNQMIAPSIAPNPLVPSNSKDDLKKYIEERDKAIMAKQ